jgi:FAD/FMN-containing dehydrogenase
VAPARASHVAAAVDFARRHRVRLVVKGGGHSYLGTSNAPDSLLVWTRDMHDIVVHDAFVPQGCVATKHRGRSHRRLAERRLLERRCGPVRPVPARLYVDLAAGGLLDERDARMLVDALFAASRHWTVGLHFNKGLAGAPADVIDEAARTAMNPVAMRSFALAIIAAEGPPGHPDVHGHEPDLVRARSDARHVRDATLALRRAVPDPGSYVAESDYFEIDWGRAFWGEHYARLRAIKSRYDPQRIFSVHHGVGSE